MNIKIYIIILPLIIAINVQARFVKDWSYQDLADNSDLIAIVQIKHETEFTGEKITKHNERYNVSETTFKVLSILKGDKELKEIKLYHLVGKYHPGHIRFSKLDLNTYLAFLKIRNRSYFEPITGQWDAGRSFEILQIKMHGNQ